MKCSRSWFGIPDIGHGGGRQFTLGYLIWTHDISLQKGSMSFPKRTLIFRATPKLTLHPWIDPDWVLYRTGLNPRASPGKTRKAAPSSETTKSHSSPSPVTFYSSLALDPLSFLPLLRPSWSKLPSSLLWTPKMASLAGLPPCTHLHTVARMIFLKVRSDHVTNRVLVEGTR